MTTTHSQVENVNNTSLENGHTISPQWHSKEVKRNSIPFQNPLGWQKNIWQARKPCSLEIDKFRKKYTQSYLFSEKRGSVDPEIYIETYLLHQTQIN